MKTSQDIMLLRLIEERLKVENSTEYEKYAKLDDMGKREYIEEHLDNLDVGFDKKLLEEVNLVLHPLLGKVITGDINKELIENHLPKSNLSIHNLIEFKIILQKYGNMIKPHSLEEESRLVLPYYLIIFEGTYTLCVNLITFLLIKNNIRYYRTRHGSKQYKKINNLRSLDKEVIYDKIAFLHDNGFSVISDICDRDLRNSIAHMSFAVFTDGSTVYEKSNGEAKKVTKDELDAKIERLISICQCVDLSLEQYYRKKYVS